MRTRLAALAVTLPLGLAALTGCSGEETSDAAAQTSATGTASGSEDAAGAEAPDAAEGEEIDAEEFVALMVSAFQKATTANLTMEMTAGGQDIDVTGQADYSSDPMSMRMDMSGMGGTGDMTMIMVDNVMYMKLAQMSEKFIKLDLDDPSNPLGGSFTGQLDPRAQAEVIEQGLRAATYVGEEDVDGETLDHYAATVDSEAMLSEMDVDAAAAGALPEEITYDLWFDQDGFYRQMVVDMGAAAGEVLIRFDDWGTDVDIEAPAADEVTDMGAMTGMTSGS